MNTNAIADLFRLPPNTPLSLVVLPILEVYPAVAAPGGSRQQLRTRTPGGIFSVHLFDQKSNVPVRFEGGVLRVTASPGARRPPIVIERDKSQKPGCGYGALVVRKGAILELFAPTEVLLAGEPCFRVLAPSPAVEQTAAASPQSAPSRTTPQSPVPAQTVQVAPRAPEECQRIPPSVVEETQRFAECIKAARQVLGPDANPADIRETARMTYEQLFSHRARAVA